MRYRLTSSVVATKQRNGGTFTLGDGNIVKWFPGDYVLRHSPVTKWQGSPYFWVESAESFAVKYEADVPAPAPKEEVPLVARPAPVAAPPPKADPPKKKTLAEKVKAVVKKKSKKRNSR